jgi:hypothetical protein
LSERHLEQPYFNFWVFFTTSREQSW